MTIRTYSELIRFPTFEERYNYLKLDGEIGRETFGFERYLNQRFYRSKEWKALRDKIIVRDHGCDLGIVGYEISDKIYIHHMNPITVDDIRNNTEYLMNPEFLISTTHNTHNAIHYGNSDLLDVGVFAERSKNDTCPWRQKEVKKNE